jgi:AraC family transcriptional regulator
MAYNATRGGVRMIRMLTEQTVVRPYYGKSTTSRAYGGLKLMEAIYAPNVQLPKHSHARASFCLILKGGYTETYGNLRLECAPCQLKFQPAGESHTDHYGTQEGRSFIIEIDDRWLDRIKSCSIPVNSPALHQELSSISLATKIRRELHQTDDITPVVVEGLMLEVIADVARKGKKAPARSESHWMEQVKELLHDRFTEHLSLSEIARSANVHPVYLASSFRQRYGCSIGDYLRKLRVDLARKLIAQTNDSLVEISLAAGFANQSHFTRVFKEHTGLTPTRYRAMLRP